MGAGIEVLRAVEGRAQPLDAPKTRQGEALDPALGRVERQQVSVAVVGHQVQGAQLVSRHLAREGLVIRPGRLPHQREAEGFLAAEPHRGSR